MESCGINHHDSLNKVKLRIELERPEEVYYGGQYLKGAVKVETDEAVDITGLKLRLFGGSCVKRTLKKAQTSQGSHKWHKEEEVYFDDTFVLWGEVLAQSNTTPVITLKLCEGKQKPENSTVEHLPSGNHVFPFNWLIPAGVPSSFQGDSGCVQYFAQCTFFAPGCRKGCKTTLVQTKHFTVLRHFDLNSSKSYKEPSKSTKEVDVSSHLCKQGQISVSLETPRAGYVAGENIHADVDVHNMSGRKIKMTVLTLREVVIYGAAPDANFVGTKELCKVYGDSVKGSKHQCWTCKSIQIPPTVPSHLDKCNIIHVSYELVLTLERTPQNIYLKVPIFIGTIPPKDSYLTTWTYKENKPPQEKNIKILKEPEGIVYKTTSSPWPNNLDPLFRPKYRYYHQATPRLKTKNIMPLEASPGQRRRSMFVCRTIRLKSHQWENFESVV